MLQKCSKKGWITIPSVVALPAAGIIVPPIPAPPRGDWAGGRSQILFPESRTWNSTPYTDTGIRIQHQRTMFLLLGSDSALSSYELQMKEGSPISQVSLLVAKGRIYHQHLKGTTASTSKRSFPILQYLTPERYAARNLGLRPIVLQCQLCLQIRCQQQNWRGERVFSTAGIQRTCIDTRCLIMALIRRPLDIRLLNFTLLYTYLPHEDSFGQPVRDLVKRAGILALPLLLETMRSQPARAGFNDPIGERTCNKVLPRMSIRKRFQRCNQYHDNIISMVSVDVRTEVSLLIF